MCSQLTFLKSGHSLP